MSVRKQSIISSFWVYVGFFCGFLNMYLFTKKGSFTLAEYGLTNLFVAIGTIIFSISGLGMNAYVYKFHPYYNDNLPKKKNDQLSWALLLPTIAFFVVTILAIVFKDIVIQKYSQRSPELIKYYFWIFPFTYFMILFNILEAYLWSIHKSVVSTFLRETGFKFFVTALLTFCMLGVINNFDTFIKIYAFSQFFLVSIAVVYLFKTNNIRLYFKKSIVTRRYYKKILTFSLFIYGGNFVYTLAQFFDSLAIASLSGMSKTGIFSFASNLTGMVQAPQRGVNNASTAIVSQAWKDKDLKKINTLYHRSALNLFIASIGLFLLVLLNFEDAITTLNLNEEYRGALSVFILLGIGKIIDMGTGINGTIIGTSFYWRFEFLSGMLLLLLTIPLNYILIKNYGIIGAGITNIIAFGIYNSIRIRFLYKKYKMHPFSIEMVYVVLLNIFCFAICYLLFNHTRGFISLFSRSILFITLYALGIWKFKLSPDFMPVLNTIKKRLGFKQK